MENVENIVEKHIEEQTEFIKPLEKFYVSYDIDGKITAISQGGKIADGTEISEEDFQNIDTEYLNCHRFQNGTIVLDELGKTEFINNRNLEELRTKRNKECFEIINRGEPWYVMLTDEQKTELNEWYQEWLAVTDTMIVPNQPDWV